jgi:transposase
MRAKESARMSHNKPKYISRNGAGADLVPDPEVVVRPQRRQFSAAYKLRILREYEASEPGAKGALLRREGLYSSHISNWRRQRERGELAGLASRRRGPKVDERAAEVVRLQRENLRLRQRLQRAELIIEVQKNVSGLLGLPPAESELDE